MVLGMRWFESTEQGGDVQGETRSSRDSNYRVTTAESPIFVDRTNSTHRMLYKRFSEARRDVGPEGTAAGSDRQEAVVLVPISSH
jgi:hypothetical protein